MNKDDKRAERVSAAANDALSAVAALEHKHDRVAALLCAAARIIGTSCRPGKWHHVLAHTTNILRETTAFYAKPTSQEGGDRRG